VITTEARVLAVDIGGTSIKAEIADGDGAVVAAGRSPTPRGAAAIDAAADLGSRLIGEAGPVKRAGIVLPGIVDPVRRVAVYSANIGWSELAFGDALERAWGVPVVADHDVTCAGWAEWQAGAGRGCSDLAFVAIGTGISAALVCGSRVLRGSGRSQPGEIGHVVVRPDGPRCGCGNQGCLEAVASASAIARAYSAATGRHAAGALDVLAAARTDERARQVWDDAIRALADGLAALGTLLAPQRIVLGGGLAQAGDALLGPLGRELAGMVCVQPVPELVSGAFGERAGLAGAALLARRDPAAREPAAREPAAREPAAREPALGGEDA
jgi:glucokinase